MTILTYLFLINPVSAQVKLSPTGTDYYNKGGGEVKSFSSTNNNSNKTKSFSDFLDNMVCNRAVHQFRWDLNKIEYVCVADLPLQRRATIVNLNAHCCTLNMHFFGHRLRSEFDLSSDQFHSPGSKSIFI